MNLDCTVLYIFHGNNHKTMVSILDGNTEIVAHVRINLCYLISWYGLALPDLKMSQIGLLAFSFKAFELIGSRNISEFFSPRKKNYFLYTSVTFSRLLYNVSTMHHRT